MIDTILIFLLGFLAAALVALIAAPALWSRAVRLTRKRLIASLPLSPNEIAAEKDRLRAGFALASRKQDMALAAARERIARQMVELGTLQEELRRGRGAGPAPAAGSDLIVARAEIVRLRGELELASASADRLAAERSRLSRELAESSSAHEEAALKLSHLQIELARAEAARPVKATRMPQGDGAVDAQSLYAALDAEQRRNGELELELQRRQRDLDAIRAETRGGDAGKVLSLDVARLSADNAALRDQVLDLAARVVAQAAAADGPGSPVDAAIADAGGRSGLADRIKALRKLAAGN